MNLLNQTPLPLSKVPAKVEELAGFAPNRSTVFRWTKRGCRGKKLRTFRAGGRVCTTVESLLEFFSDDDAGVDLASTRSADQAEAFLAAEGI